MKAPRSLLSASISHPNSCDKGSFAQEATFAKSTFRPGNTALDRCGAAPKAVIDEGCGDFLGLDGGPADKVGFRCGCANVGLREY